MCNVNQVREITHDKKSCGKINPEIKLFKKQTSTEVKQIEV